MIRPIFHLSGYTHSSMDFVNMICNGFERTSAQLLKNIGDIESGPTSLLTSILLKTFWMASCDGVMWKVFCSHRLSMKSRSPSSCSCFTYTDEKNSANSLALSASSVAILPSSSSLHGSEFDFRLPLINCQNFFGSPLEFSMIPFT